MSTIMARERATLDKNLEQALHPVDLLELLGVRDAGSQILDVRDGADYAKRHLEGSVNIGLSGQYATWPAHCSTVRSPSLIVAEPGREQEAAVRLGRIGFDGVKGYLQGGMQALAGRADLLRSTERISAPELNQELTGVNPPLLLDVRSPREWAAKHIESSVNIALNRLLERLGELPRDRRIAIHCAGGYRSSIGASILHQHGITNLRELAGGLAAWEAASLSVTGNR
jgi:rhodanese-related sulfurtransferase